MLLLLAPFLPPRPPGDTQLRIGATARLCIAESPSCGGGGVGGGADADADHRGACVTGACVTADRVIGDCVIGDFVTADWVKALSIDSRQQPAQSQPRSSRESRQEELMKRWMHALPAAGVIYVLRLDVCLMHARSNPAYAKAAPKVRNGGPCSADFILIGEQEQGRTVRTDARARCASERFGPSSRRRWRGRRWRRRR